MIQTIEIKSWPTINGRLQLDLSEYSISSVISVDIDGCNTKFEFNTIIKVLTILDKVRDNSNIIIKYYPMMSKIREEKLNILGI